MPTTRPRGVLIGVQRETYNAAEPAVPAMGELMKKAEKGAHSRQQTPKQTRGGLRTSGYQQTNPLSKSAPSFAPIA